MTQYEVKTNDSPAWRQVDLLNYNENKKQFLVTYNHSSKSVHYVDPTDVRPVDDVPSNWKPKIDEQCECKIKIDEKPYAWWPCEVKGIKGNTITVTLLTDDQPTKTIQKDFLRPLNQKKTLSARNMTKENIDIPPDLLYWVKSNPKEIKDLQSRLTHMIIDEKSKQLILIGNKKALHLAKSIIVLQFQKQKDLKDLEFKNQFDEAKFEEQRQKERNALTRTFPIQPLFFLLGPKRKNIQAIKQEFPDIVYVRPKNGICEVAAMNLQTLDDVCEKLEFIGQKVAIPKKEMSSIIGSQGLTINKIKKCAGPDIRIIAENKFQDDVLHAKERHDERLNNRKKYPEHAYNKYNKHQQANDVDEFLDDIDIDVDDIDVNNIEFNKNVDLTNGNIQDGIDHLIVIGRRSRVAFCITVIEVTLLHLRKLQQHVDNIKRLKQSINDLTGYENKKRKNKTKYNQQEESENYNDQKTVNKKK